MAAQFCSSLADNAIFVAAVSLLRYQQAAEWQQIALVSVFAFSYVVFAPLVGALADRFPKGRVMFGANTVKMIGAVLMLTGAAPLLAYALIGLGAALYAPAKYGILTEMLPAEKLVVANGWLEGLTIGSIVAGLSLGGLLVSLPETTLSSMLAAAQIDRAAVPLRFAVAASLLVYVLSAAFNLFVRASGVAAHALPPVSALWRDFARCNRVLWQDRSGGISLATTTLFWGAGGPSRYLVLSWGAAALGLGVAAATQLMSLVVVGTVLGVVAASRLVTLDAATRVLPLGVGMGLVLLLLTQISTLVLAAPMLLVLGAAGGFLVVPMNALLQHRGHTLMSAGRSIAVQNFNEQAAILAFGAACSALSALGAGVNLVLASLGVVVAGCSLLIIRRVRRPGAEIPVSAGDPQSRNRGAPSSP